MSGAERVIKSTQEQAVAAWITHLNQMRLDELIFKLQQQDINLEQALSELAELKEFIGDSSHILGSAFTKHGEIAEHVQVNFSNARHLINGLKREYTFDGVGRTAPEDYLKNGQGVQSKFYNGIKNTLTGNHGLRDHLATYPDFVKNGGSYDIPKDQYEQIIDVLKRGELHRSSLSKSEESLYNYLKNFESETGLKFGTDIKPAVVDYKDVQQGAINSTVDKEEQNIKSRDQERRNEAYEASKPTLKEGAKAAGIGAAAEGGVALAMAIAAKRKSGKKLSDFTAEDWKDVGLQSSEGALKGGIRGGAIYALTNFTATPANIASAYVTAAFGIASQAKALEEGRVSQEDFVINCETVCLDVSVSAISSLAGQMLIPVPVLGAVVGNIAGEFAYEICKKYAAGRSEQIIEGYRREMEQLNIQLQYQYLQVLIEIRTEFKKFEALEQLAFDENANKAFFASIELGRMAGVSETKLLKNKEEIDAYFIN